MLNNYLKISLRKLRKYTLYSYILIGGLSIGIAACLLIIQHLRVELSYDSFHEKKDQIYRLNVGNIHSDRHSAVSSGAMAPAFAPDFPEIENYVRFRHFPSLLQFEDQSFYEDDFFYTDSTVFEVFDFELLEGDKLDVLAEPFSLVMTESAAKKYFGDSNAIGKTVEINDLFEFQVKGILKDTPKNSHLQFDFLASVSSLRQHPDESVRYWQLNSWYSHYYHTYLLLNEKANASELGEKIELIAKEYSNPEFFELYGQEMGLYLQAMNDIHLEPIHGEIIPQGDRQNLYILGIVALFILFIVCSNYANLSAALALKHNKNIGVRKVLGANKKQLLTQFFNESFLISGVGVVLALALTQLGGNYFSQLFSYDLNLSLDILPFAISLFLIAGLLGGIYPAFIGTSFKPASIFRQVDQKLGGMSVMKGLVVFQFTITGFLIVAALVVFQQMDFMQKMPLGMNMDQVLVIPTRANPNVTDQFSTFENELKQLPEVKQTTISELVPGEQMFGFVCKFEGMEAGANFSTNVVSYDFFETYDIPVVAGRTFQRDIASDTLERAIINERLARDLGWENPQDAIGKIFDFGNDGENIGEVLGVVKDFHFRSLKFDIRPILFIMDDHFYQNISIKLSNENLTETIATIEKSWQSFFPNLPFEYFFADEQFGRQYAADQRMAQLLFLLVGLAIFLASIGLFGLSTLAAQQRVKEVGIRKVLGASVGNITSLLSKDFLKLVGISIIFAFPLAYYFMDKWLENFAYQMELNVDLFLIATVLILIISVLTVSYQSIKAALANPVESLRGL